MADATYQLADHAAWRHLEIAMTTPDGRRDPSSHFAAMHKSGDYLIDPRGTVYVFGYAAVAETLRSPFFIHVASNGEPPAYLSELSANQAEALRETSGELAVNLPQLDPPDHTRLRRLITPFFSARELKNLRDDAHRILDHIILLADAYHPIDLVTAIAQPFPAELVGSLVGVPPENRLDVARLVSQQTAEFDPTVTYEGRLLAARAKRQHANYIREIVARPAADDQGGLVSLLKVALQDGELDEAEMVALLQIIHIGGYDTTTHMTGNGIVALLRNPKQFMLLVQDPSLITTAVRELLRYDTSIGPVGSVAVEGAKIGEVAIPAGSECICLLPAANHDPKAFVDPSTLDIKRLNPLRHLSFGAGIHFCLGMQLAMLELEIVIGTLVSRFPSMQLAAPPVRADAFAFRRYESIPVLLRPSRAVTPIGST